MEMDNSSSELLDYFIKKGAYPHGRAGRRGASHVDGRRRQKRAAPIADINVTPMADIMIVLLIIFMVITPMLQKGVDVKLPMASNTTERKDEPKTITVAIKQDGTTYLNGIMVDSQPSWLPQVKERLEDAARRRARWSS